MASTGAAGSPVPALLTEKRKQKAFRLTRILKDHTIPHPGWPWPRYRSYPAENGIIMPASRTEKTIKRPLPFLRAAPHCRHRCAPSAKYRSTGPGHAGGAFPHDPQPGGIASPSRMPGLTKNEPLPNRPRWISPQTPAERSSLKPGQWQHSALPSPSQSNARPDRISLRRQHGQQASGHALRFNHSPP